MCLGRILHWVVVRGVEGELQVRDLGGVFVDVLDIRIYEFRGFP